MAVKDNTVINGKLHTEQIGLHYIVHHPVLGAVIADQGVI